MLTYVGEVLSWPLVMAWKVVRALWPRREEAAPEKPPSVTLASLSHTWPVDWPGHTIDHRDMREVNWPAQVPREDKVWLVLGHDYDMRTGGRWMLVREWGSDERECAGGTLGYAPRGLMIRRLYQPGDWMRA